MNAVKLAPTVFWIAAAYDGLLGAAFLLAGPQLFGLIGVPQPNHWAYIHFPAALLLVFAGLFAAVARRPVERRDLIWAGVGLKAAYVGTVAGHAATGGLATVWIVFGAADAAFLVVFLWCWAQLRSSARAG